MRRARLCPQYVSGLVGKYEANWTKEGIDLVKGLASFDDAHTVRVQLCAGGEQVIKAAKVLVAVGGRPAMPEDVPGIELAISSDGFFELEQQPKKVAVLGAGCATPATPCDHPVTTHAPCSPPAPCIAPATTGTSPSRWRESSMASAPRRTSSSAATRCGSQ